MDLLGDQWTLLILQQVFLRVRRFAEMRQRLGIGEAVLAARLRTLVAAGVLVRVPYRDQQRTRQEYRLTPRGLDLWLLLVEIVLWERAWVPGRAAELPTVRHLVCGRTTTPLLACAACGQPLSTRDTRAIRPAGVPIGGATPARRFRRRSWPRPDDPLLFYPETVELLGDRWHTAIMVAAFLRVRRFADLERELGIRPSVLISKLRRLVELGVLRMVPTERGGTEYRLTDKGRGFFGVFAVIADWAGRWLAPDPTTGLWIEHVPCGNRLRPALACDQCGALIGRQEMRLILDRPT